MVQTSWHVDLQTWAKSMGQGAEQQSGTQWCSSVIAIVNVMRFLRRACADSSKRRSGPQDEDIGFGNTVEMCRNERICRVISAHVD